MVGGLAVLALLLVAGCGPAGRSDQAGPAEPAVVALPGAEPAGATQTSEGGQVTIAVTWEGPSAGLVFRVAMDTHSVNLDPYDLRELAVLRTDQGVEVRPSQWDAPPGGHHRAGTLAFPATASDGKPVLGPGARSVTLIIRDVGGVPERTFQWTW